MVAAPPGRDATPGQYASGCQGRLAIYWNCVYPAFPAAGASYHGGEKGE